MLTFKYEARDSRTGQLIKAEVEADNEQSASKLIRQEGLSPLQITMKEAGSSNPISKFQNRVKAKDRILFARQLSTLINAGLPLVQSLRSVADQTVSKPLKVVINKIITDIEAGGAFAASLEKHPKVFNQVFISLVSAGEASGTLDKALERVALQQEKDAEILSKVRGAMAYPIIVLMVMGGVVGFMIVKVLPQVESIYKGIPGTKLPFITVALLAVSHFIINFWWVVIIITVLVVFATTKWARTGPGKEIIDKLKMKMWPVGPLFMKMYMARFARTGTTLVSSGVPLLQVLDITSRAVNNVHIGRSLNKAAEKVRGGKALSAAIDKDPNFLELVPNMLRIGEQSGQIEQMMEKVAEYYEKEVDQQIKTISTIIEPVMMVLLGVVAFILVAAILLPIYGLAGQTQNIR
ncbi:MAG: putative Type pilus assembly protein PilC [Candidatus Saccharibacteria bacterium]|nr:putative Type pilus assembly protein PilC [Candidatus Saccharibacteria bacterium]